MAAQVLDHPESKLRRAALAHAVSEIIRTQGDEPVLHAIELASDLQAARAIRAAAESACEEVSISDSGTERRARLFSVALVVRFAEPMTTQEFDAGLASISDSAALLAGAQHACPFVWPQVFSFDDLAGSSFSDVRHGTIMASAPHARTSGGTTAPLPIAARAQRRSATFLRYLVGCQVSSGTTSDHRSDRTLFCDCVRSAVRRSIATAREVAVIYTGHFYEPLWQGLRTYHRHRLAEVVRMIAALGPPSSELAASITFPGGRDEMAVQVRFFARGKPLGHHAYRMMLEPLADARESVARIEAELDALGVTPHAAMADTKRHASEVRRVERNSRADRSRAGAWLTIPL
jgi:hypothetical protein